MAKNRIEEFLGDRPATSQQPRPAEDPFVTCPAIFFNGLSAEAYRAQPQIYQVAFERARATIQQRDNSYFGNDGEGI